MPESIYQSEVNNLLNSTTFTCKESPTEWRDHWIYFLLVDRFNNPDAKPTPSDYPCNVYQGGNFEGIKRNLGYLKKLGVGAVWISPVLMNPQWFKDYWGGYGIFDFLRIEPRFCSDPDKAMKNPDIADEEFSSLVKAIHDAGMYVILDIVLNHTGDLFKYSGLGDSAHWNPNSEYVVNWRDGGGSPHEDWPEIGSVPSLPRNAGVWPKELQQNDFFRRKGSVDEKGDITKGDFDRLKELVTEYLVPGSNVYPVRNILIRAHQYLIAKFDLDGFRIDTLQYVEADFARVFGNAIREFALSIGKKNFFTFGEVCDESNESQIARYVGRDTSIGDGLIGVDAAIDFPMRKRLFDVCKAKVPPCVIAQEADKRRETLKSVVSSHGDASRYYVTFLDNHDVNERFNVADWPEQTRLALTCLMTMQGIPCIYYGTEQGLTGHGNRREYVREALWGQPTPFSENTDFYRIIQELTKLRDLNPALRYGRQYFRQCSGDGTNFGYSPYPGGVLAFSRILNDREILVVGNASTSQAVFVHVIVDSNLNPNGKKWSVLFSSNQNPTAPEDTVTHGVIRTIKVSLQPMEAQVLG